MSRSGTTVAQRLLSDLEGVWVPAETHFWRHAAAMAREFRFPLGPEDAAAALRWFAALESSKGLEFDPDAALRTLGGRAFQWDLFEAIVRALSPPGSTALGEKTPDHLRWAEQLLAAVPGLRLIGLVRDPREVLRSHRTVPWGTTDPVRFAEKWIELSRRLRDCQRLFADRVLAVRYEDLVRDPKEFRRRAAAHVAVADVPRPTHGPAGLLFAAEEWWKRDALAPVEPREDRWRSQLPDDAIAVLEAACGDEMRLWGYRPVRERASPTNPVSFDDGCDVRADGARITALRLPINERWTTDRDYADTFDAEKRDLRTAVATGRGELAVARRSNDALRERAEEFRTDVDRLQDQLNRQTLAFLTADRARLVAEGHLRRTQARRWWRFGAALGAFRRRPWRVAALARSIWALAANRTPAPPMPDLRVIDQRIIRLTGGRVLPGAAGPATDSSGAVEAARSRYRAGRYEAALELLDGLPRDERSTRRACLLARDCHVKMGELSKALSELRRSLEAGPSEIHERQARLLLGRLRETDTSWLPDAGPPATGRLMPDERRILHIVKESLPFFERGYTVRSHTTFLAQKEAGFDPVVVTSLGFPRHQGFDSFAPGQTIDGIAHHRLDLGPEYRLNEIPFDLQLSDCATLTRRIAERARPALIQAGSGYRGYETALVGLAVARRLGVPFIYEVRSFLEQTWTSDIARSETGEYYERRRSQEIRCMLEADLVLTIAEQMRDEISARGVPAEKIHVVPNVVDVDRFAPRAADPVLRRSLGFEGRPVLGYISNLGPREGIEHLIRAVAVLRQSGVDAGGLVVGDGPARESLQELVTELGLRGHVVLTGHVDNARIEDYYAQIDLFVVPRIDERASRLVTPLKPLEAMAMERPVIAADLPALRELVAPGQRGEVFPPADADALAKVAGELLQDDERRARLARAGRSWVSAERTIAANARRYDAVLGSLRRGVV
jgi:glycosyltransferase involved in cell wall biosynthesis